MLAPRKTQLPYHTVLQDNVATEAMQDPGIHSKQVGRVSQHVYLDIAGSAGMPVGGYMQEKTRLVHEMKESTNQAVRDVNVQICTGQRWKAQTLAKCRQEELAKVLVKDNQGREEGDGHSRGDKHGKLAS